MKKIIIKNGTLLFLLFATANAISQDKVSWKSAGRTIYSIAGDNELTTSKLNDTHKWGIGVSVQVEVPLTSKWYVMADAGYINFFNRDEKNDRAETVPGVHFMPVKAGLRYFPFWIFYVQAEAGAGFIFNKTELHFNKSSSFIYAAQSGVRVPVGKKHFIDGGIQYESSAVMRNNPETKINFFRLRLAYAFTVK